ncbi:hypothetical protein DPMN_061164 [Dreissena polymorpha]|uniref:Uncharacterized protein n=1 Tax=Dreissena polymorpha TaxID=45954 RepID=A0A9D4C6H6_DREPO|nr:hypothetical protein DPMN_061164 [Dreissena polymorpha]
MALTSAERQRRFRAKGDADPQKREAYLNRGLDRYRNECKTGEKKPIAELPEREKISVRKRWRQQKRKDRARNKDAQKILKNVQTPPSSEDEQHSHQKSRALKKRRRDEAKVYRDKRKLEFDIKHLKKKVDMYKKRLHRQTEQSNVDTPM